MSVVSLYIHIPFCRRKCNYCDFASYPLAGRERELAAYPDLLRLELTLYEDIDLSRLNTIYLGGGTPSLMPAGDIRSILSWFPPAGEISLEANPETLSPEYLAELRSVGVNRLTLGAQSFQEEHLRAMGRGHSPNQTRQAMEWAREAGFDNIGLDLIYGLPGQTLSQWREDMERAMDLEPEHLSLYCLTLSETTPWGRSQAAGELSLPEDDLAADMMELAMERLPAQGWPRYEIANFARLGWESRHNLSYWRREDYLGLGAAAASCLGARRWSNLTGLEEYSRSLRSGHRPVVFNEMLDMEQVLAEGMFLGLRLQEGVDCAAFAARYGADPRRRYKRELARLTKKGLLIEEEGCLRLTNRGVLLGDRVFEEFV